jgi:hypothetical protein
LNDLYLAVSWFYGQGEVRSYVCIQRQAAETQLVSQIDQSSGKKSNKHKGEIMRKKPVRKICVISLLTLFLLCTASGSPAIFAADNSGQIDKAGTNTDDKIPQTFGVGVKLGGSSFGVGVNARYWSNKNVGFEVGYSHYSFGISSMDYGYDVSSHQITPSLLFSFSRVNTPSLQLRPYVGGGINYSRYSFKSDFDEYYDLLGINESSSKIGGQGFAGLELAFKKLPKLSFSGDLGYYSTSTPYVEMKVGGISFAATINYYLK